MPFSWKAPKNYEEKKFPENQCRKIVQASHIAPMTIKLVRKDAYVMDDSRFFLHTIRDRHFKNRPMTDKESRNRHLDAAFGTLFINSTVL